MNNKICPNCQIEFLPYYKTAKYCSKQCYWDYRRKYPKVDSLVTSPCFVCRKSTTYHPSQKRGEQILCSTECYYKYKSTLKPPNYIDDDTLIKALKQANEINEYPYLSSLLYEKIRKEHGLPSKVVIQRRFGTWDESLKLAGLPTDIVNDFPWKRSVAPVRNRKKQMAPRLQKSRKIRKSPRKPRVVITKDEAISDLLRVSAIVDQTPTMIQYRKHGNFSWHVIAKAITGDCDKWALSCEMAGLLPHTTHEGNGNGKSVQFKTPSGNMINLQSSYEVRFANTLNRWGENWICHQELDAPIEFSNPKGRTGQYRADFYIPTRDIYLDTKGWFRPQGRGKMILVHACNPDLKIYLVFKECLSLAEASNTFDEWFDLAQSKGLFDWR